MLKFSLKGAIRYVCFAQFLFAVFAANSAPISVVDDIGRTVEIPGPAKRIVSLAPHLTEILFELGVGDEIKGTVQYSDYPAAAKAIPRLGDAFSVNVEAVMALQPDIVFAWRTGGSNRALEKLERLGVPIYYNEAPHLLDIGPGVIKIARLVGRESVGDKLAEAFELTLSSNRVKANRDRPTVFFQISDQGLYTVNSDHLIGESIELCGGKNLFGDVATPVPLVSKEAVVAGAPDLVVLTHVPGTPESSWVSEWPRFGISRDRIATIDPNLISRPGLRMQEGIRQLCTLIAQSNRR